MRPVVVEHHRQGLEGFVPRWPQRSAQGSLHPRDGAKPLFEGPNRHVQTLALRCPRRDPRRWVDKAPNRGCAKTLLGLLPPTSGPLAQLVEQWTLNPLAEGSSPSWPTPRTRRDSAGFLVCGAGGEASRGGAGDDSRDDSASVETPEKSSWLPDHRILPLARTVRIIAVTLWLMKRALPLRYAEAHG